VGDDVRIKQIMINLLINAIKYTPSGMISLDVRMKIIDEHSLKLIFVVSDSGVGIKQEDVSKLFIDFSRLEGTYNSKIQGTGLGLSITKAFCELMGGEIKVMSEYGRGSIFTATVIQYYVKCDQFASVDHPAQKKVLVFEDRRLHLKSIVRSLEDLGVTLKCPENFEEFIKSLQSKVYDYVFVASKYVDYCFCALGDAGKRALVVVITDLGEESGYFDLVKILRPVYSLPIANILNGGSGKVHENKYGVSSDFFIPDAKILVVDDIASNLRVAKVLIAHYGAQVETCMSGREAIQMVKSNRYDIVFMDHMMPDVDGLEAVSAIRAFKDDDGYYGNLPVIALTANAVSGQKEIFLEKGMSDFLSKPIEMQELDNILKKWIPHDKQLKRPQAMKEEQLRQKIDLNITGIEVEWAIKNIGGSVDVYLDILRTFQEDVMEKGSKIKKTREDMDIKNYKILVHSIKGASKSIGAFELADFAARMEEAAIMGNSDIIIMHTDKLLADMYSLASRIDDALRTLESDSDLEASEEKKYAGNIDLQMKLLRSALMSMEISTVNELLIKDMTLPLDPDTKRIVSEVEQHVLMFEYDEALRKIDKLLAAFN
jgi:CheY-like chemotaxis protein